MRKLLGGAILVTVLLAGCGDADGGTPGDRPSETTQQNAPGGY